MAIGNIHRLNEKELIEQQKADGSYVEVKETKPEKKDGNRK